MIAGLILLKTFVVVPLPYSRIRGSRLCLLFQGKHSQAFKVPTSCWDLPDTPVCFLNWQEAQGSQTPCSTHFHKLPHLSLLPVSISLLPDRLPSLHDGTGEMAQRLKHLHDSDDLRWKDATYSIICHNTHEYFTHRCTRMHMCARAHK